MDLRPALKWAALQVARALHDFGAKKGWGRDDYRIFITVNTAWNVLNVEVVSDHFANGELDRSYDEIMDYLENEFRDVPEVYESIGLVLRPLGGYTFFGEPRLGPTEVEVDFELLNPGVEDWRTPFRPGVR